MSAATQCVPATNTSEPQLPVPPHTGAVQCVDTTSSPPTSAVDLMNILMYGPSAGWNGDGARVDFVGQKGLLEKMIRTARISHNTTCADAAAALVTLRQSPELRAIVAAARKTQLVAEKKLEAGLIHCANWMTLRDDFYHCGSVYATAGLAERAAVCFFHAAFLNRAFDAQEEAVVALSAAVDHLQVHHPVLAAEVQIKLAQCYESAGLTLHAARARRAAAGLYETHVHDKAGAAALYSAAIATYMQLCHHDDISETLCEVCIERLCILHVEMGHYDVAESLFLDRARNRVLRAVVREAEARAASPVAQTAGRADTTDDGDEEDKEEEEEEEEEVVVVDETDDRAGKREYAKAATDKTAARTSVGKPMVQRAVGKRSVLPRTLLYLYATLCRLAIGSEDDSAYFDALYMTRKLFERLQDEDRNYQKGSANILMRGIIASFDASSLHEFDLAVRTFVELKTTTPSVALDALLTRCRSNLVAHIERFL